MKVTLNIGTVKQDMTPGQVLGDWRFIVTLAATAEVVATKGTGDTSTMFDLPAGDYAATAQRFDTLGLAFGGAASVTFTVPPVVADQGDAAANLSVSFS